MRPMGIEELLLRVEETGLTIESAKELIEKAEATRVKEMLAVANVLFDLAGLAEHPEEDRIKEERSKMMRLGKVNIFDQRRNTWNGDPEDIQFEWDGVEFACHYYGRPSVWFWSRGMACFYMNADPALPEHMRVPFWVIFSMYKAVVVADEKENGNEEENRNLH